MAYIYISVGKPLFDFSIIITSTICLNSNFDIFSHTWLLYPYFAFSQRHYQDIEKRYNDARRPRSLSTANERLSHRWFPSSFASYHNVELSHLMWSTFLEFLASKFKKKLYSKTSNSIYDFFHFYHGDGILQLMVRRKYLRFIVCYLNLFVTYIVT